MLKNYLKVTLNNLSKNKVNSFINITGLAIGIASCILILLYVVRELSYDNYHQELDQLHRVAILDTPDNLGQGIASISYPAAEVLTEEFPEVEQVARLGQLFDQDPAIEIDDRLFAEDRFYFADNSVFELLTIPFLKGDSETALSAPNSIVLSEETARKYFGNIDVVGKTLLVNFNNMSTDYQITGVVRNAPENTHFKYDVFASLDNIFNGLPAGFADAMKSWYMYRFWTYVKLTPGTDAQAFEAKLKHIEQKYFPPTRSNVHLFLQPVKDIHLHSNLNNEVEPNNDIRYIYIFSGIAILVLVIACINFMNLTTARSINRAREVGMRKVLGALRSQLMSQFTIESLLVTALSVLVAFGLVELLTNVLNDLTGLQLETNYLQSAWLPIGFVFLTLIVGLLSGLYPAFFLSAFQPVKTLKGAFARSSSGAGLRKALVIAQMAITVILLVGIVTISKQMDYIRDKKLGFKKEQMLLIKASGTVFVEPNTYHTFKDRILQLPGVESATRNNSVIGKGLRIRSLYFNEISDDKKEAVPFLFAAHDIAETYGLEIVKGRDFSEEFADTNYTYLVNESAVKQYDLEPVLGRIIASGDNNTFSGPIVGVVKDFHFAPLHKSIEPLVIGLFDGGLPFMTVRLRTGTLQRTIAQVKDIWREHEPNRPMNFFFLDERLDTAYRFETQLGNIVTSFTILAIFVASLGLFGMALYASEQRTKEIGIRKVLGASVQNIMLVFSFDFVKLMLIANVVAWPIAYFTMRRWLDDFAYRINIGIDAFALAGIIALLITLITVSYQVIRAALANPVQALRYE